jgi:pyrroline-5-carboxylate reductase
MKLRKRIGMIGCGNMGGAILIGLLKKGLVSPSQVAVYDKVLPKARALARRTGVKLATSNAVVVGRSEIAVLAVKPQDLFEAAAEFRRAFTARHLLITILAGTPVAKVRRAVGPKPKIVRAMPNLGAQVGEAITVLTGDASSVRLAEAVFSGCGRTLRLPEKDFDLVTAVSGSGPAYFFLLMELLAKEARAHGLSEKAARELAVQTGLGAGLLARNSSFPPAELRRRVTSKGGTTEAALRVFEKAGLAAIISRGLRAALKRGRALSRG